MQAAVAPVVLRIAESMARRRAARARARRAAAAAGGATTGPKVRRGSWHTKIRSTHFENALEKYKRWRYNPLTSPASQHFKDDASPVNASAVGGCSTLREHLMYLVSDV